MPTEVCEIDIFGSCVTRDIFNYNKKNILKVQGYVARQSVISAMSKPVAEEIDFGIQSPFQEKLVQNDFKKNTFQYLKDSLAEWLIIDLIDERLLLGEYTTTIVTLSNELVGSEYFKKYKNSFIECNIKEVKVGKAVQNTTVDFEYSYIFKDITLDSIVKAFCDKITQIYDPEKIIIHNAYMMNCFLDENMIKQKFPKHHIRNNEKINRRLKYMYKHMKAYISQAQVLDLGEGYCASSNHQWGLAPMHYQEEYYISALNQIQKIINVKIV